MTRRLRRRLLHQIVTNHQSRQVQLQQHKGEKTEWVSIKALTDNRYVVKVDPFGWTLNSNSSYVQKRIAMSVQIQQKTSFHLSQSTLRF